MSADSGSIGAALETVAAQLEPLEDSDEAFYARLARALARVAGARAAVLLRLEAGRLEVLAQSDRVDQARLRSLIEPPPDLKAAAAAPPASPAAWLLPLTARDVPVGALALFDSTSGGFSDRDRTTIEVAAAAAVTVCRQRRRVRRLLAARTEEAQRVRSAADHAIELDEMKGRILNLAGHELRGPITVIRGYLEMIADGSLDERALRRVLPILNGKAAQMDALITQMLEVARIEDGRVELMRELVDLCAVCRETVDVAGLIAPPGISLFLERPPHAINVVGDRGRLGTIVANLVDNAIKYSPEGGPVRCRTGVQDGRAYVEVRDSGIGIAEADLPALFTRFGRIVTPENSHIPGTGLGLNISRDLARMHGGDITVSSRPGKGSTFTLWLPLADQP